MKRLIYIPAILFLLIACVVDVSFAEKAKKLTDKNQPDDVVATVGGEEITYSLLSTMLNSSAMVGLSVPALGTKDRNYVIVTLLDKAITANLLYLDAKKQGVDKNPVYIQDLKKFRTAILASLYKSKNIIGDIVVTDDEVAMFHKTSGDKDTELTDDDVLAIKSKLRKQKVKQIEVSLREKIREGLQIKIEKDVLDPSKDNDRHADEVIAYVRIHDEDIKVTWGEIRSLMLGAESRATRAAFYIDVDDERLKRIDEIIDTRIMAKKALNSGLDKDESYVKRLAEFNKTRLINLHRSGLVHNWSLSDSKLKKYFEEHISEIAVPEMRKVQMLVLKTKSEAEEIKKKINSEKLTIYQAAVNHSIVPDAKNNLGEIGWVAKGSGFSGLDEFTFAQEPDELAGPVESPAGWHLIKVLDVQAAQFQEFENPQARNKALRMYMRDQLNKYVVELRTKSFSVAVNDAVLEQQFKKESDFILALNKKAEDNDSLTRHREQEMKKWFQ